MEILEVTDVRVIAIDECCLKALGRVYFVGGLGNP